MELLLRPTSSRMLWAEHRYESEGPWQPPGIADEIVTPDFIDHEAPADGVRGPAILHQMVTMFRGAFPDLHFDIQDMFAEGDRVAARCTMPTMASSWVSRRRTRRSASPRSTSSALKAPRWQNTGASRTRPG
jgi:SnoaL-like polyketide cyclase